jgi:ribosomal protein S18 acetylase RimI-like enzyme
MTSKSHASAGAGAAIRLADVSDAPALAVLRYALRSSTGVATEPETEFLRRCAGWMEAHLKESDSWRCWIAEEGGKPIGALWLQLVEKIPNPRAEPEHHGYITNFYVQPTARGRGIGSQMLRAALRFCETRDVHAVILWPTDRSRTLYERHGFAVRKDIMELIIQA